MFKSIMIYKPFSGFISLIFPQSEDLVKSSKFITGCHYDYIEHDKFS